MLFSDNQDYIAAITALSKVLIALGEDEIDFLFGGGDSGGDGSEDDDSEGRGYMLLTDLYNTINELDPKLCKKPPKPAWSPQAA